MVFFSDFDDKNLLELRTPQEELRFDVFELIVADFQNGAVGLVNDDVILEQGGISLTLELSFGRHLIKFRRFTVSNPVDIRKFKVQSRDTRPISTIWIY